MTVYDGGQSGESAMQAAYRRVDGWLEAGATLDMVSAEIEREPLARDARDALWLYAWVTIERDQVYA